MLRWCTQLTRPPQKGSTVIQNRDRNERKPGGSNASSPQTADVFARPEGFGRRQVPTPESTRAPAVESVVDAATIMASIGEAPYLWSIDSDRLFWGTNATQVLMADSLATISTGRNYAKLLAADATTSRFDAVMRSTE